MYRKFCLALLLTIGLAGCETPWEEERQAAVEASEEITERQLSAAEIREALAGNTLYRQESRFFRTWHFASFHRRNGTVTGRLWRRGGQREFSQGTWEVTDENRYCRIWKDQEGGGETACFEVIRAGTDITFVYASGAKGDADRYSYSLDFGNTYGL